MKEKIIRIEDIKISKSFKKHPPRRAKMEEKWEYYRKTGRLMEEIILDNDGVLINGYTSYLIAEADGIKKVKVKQMFDEEIHKKNKMYLADKIRIISALIIAGFFALCVGWWIAQIILMCMEVGG